MDFRKTIKLLVFDFDGTLHTLNMDWQRAREIVDIDDSDETLGHAIDRLKKHNPEALKALDDLEREALVADTLDPLVGDALKRLSMIYHVAILSRNSGKVIREFLARNGISVEYIVGRMEVDKLKPHPEGLKQIFRHFNIQATKTLMVGDTWQDLLLARNAGCLCIIIGDNFAHEAEKPSMRVADMQELEKLLN